MVFQLAETVEKHLAVHFSGTQQSGSIFNPALFAGPKDVLTYLEKHSPQRIIKQRNNRLVYEFELAAPQVAGHEGIGLKESLPSDSIELQKRNGFWVEVGMVDLLPETSFFCVVIQAIPEGFEVVTAFPGCYAPPIPYEGQSKDEYVAGKAFWDKNVLLKERKSAIGEPKLN